MGRDWIKEAVGGIIFFEALAIIGVNAYERSTDANLSAAVQAIILIVPLVLVGVYIKSVQGK